MEDFGSLLILLFIVWRVLGSVLGGGRQPKPPGRTGSGQRPERRESEASVPGRDAEPQSAAPGSAADMIPDDLWEILTGERRRPAPVSAPQPPQPVSTPAEAEPVEWSPTAEGAGWKADGWDEEGWDEDLEPAPPPLPGSREVVSLEEEPVVRSLEVLDLSPEERHAAFRAKIAAAAAPAAAPRRRGPAVRLRLGGRSELQRAMILREVLGPPKALE